MELEPNDCDVGGPLEGDGSANKSLNLTISMANDMEDPNEECAMATTSSATTEIAPAAKTLSRSHLRRKRKRQSEANESNKRMAPSTHAIEHHLQDGVRNPLATSLRVEDLPTTSCGYQALNMPGHGGAKAAILEELLKRGYELVKNDG